jgi:hypothetical protein
MLVFGLTCRGGRRRGVRPCVRIFSLCALRSFAANSIAGFGITGSWSNHFSVRSSSATKVLAMIGDLLPVIGTASRYGGGKRARPSKKALLLRKGDPVSPILQITTTFLSEPTQNCSGRGDEAYFDFPLLI